MRCPYCPNDPAVLCPECFGCRVVSCCDGLVAQPEPEHVPHEPIDLDGLYIDIGGES